MARTLLHINKSLVPAPNFKIIGHRGAGKLAAENTLAAFKLAKTLGLNWVEFDIQPCGSGEWVVVHDDTLDRTTTGTGAVQQVTYEYLKSLDAGSWFDPSFKNERIPLLSDLLDLLSHLQIQANIEIKGPIPNFSQLLPSLLHILEKHGSTTQAPPLISSFDLDILQAVQEATRLYPLGYIVRELEPKAIDSMLDNRFFSLHCNYKYLLPNLLEEIVTYPFSTLLYTLNDPVMAKGYFEKGITAIFSDFPNLFNKDEVRNIET